MPAFGSRIVNFKMGTTMNKKHKKYTTIRRKKEYSRRIRNITPTKGGKKQWGLM